MKAPSLDDRAVKVTAYLTDETFGYEHWRAAQFSAPKRDRPGILIICRDDQECAAILTELEGEGEKP